MHVIDGGGARRSVWEARLLHVIVGGGARLSALEEGLVLVIVSFVVPAGLFGRSASCMSSLVAAPACLATLPEGLVVSLVAPACLHWRMASCMSSLVGGRACLSTLPGPHRLFGGEVVHDRVTEVVSAIRVGVAVEI